MKKSKASSSSKSKVQAQAVAAAGTDDKNILTQILAHHEGLKEAIEVLTAEGKSAIERKAALRRFLPLLKTHAQAEQETLYVACEDVKALKDMSLEGYIEHDVAEDLAYQLQNSGFEQHWTEEIEARAKVLAEIVEHHIHEEEHELFPEVRRSFTKEELDGMGFVYAEKFERIANRTSFFDFAIPSVDEVKESWSEVFGLVSSKVSDYVKNINPNK